MFLQDFIMKKYLYNLCVCIFGVAVVFQADEAFGMKKSTSRKTYAKDDGDVRRSRSVERDEKGERKRSKSAPARLEANCPCINEFNESIEGFIEKNEALKIDKFVKKFDTFRSDFIEGHNGKNTDKKKLKTGKSRNEDEEDKPTKKKLKNRSDEEDYDDEEEDEEELTKNKLRRSNSSSNLNSSDKSSGIRRSKSEPNLRSYEKDESWKHRKADASYLLEKHKVLPLFNNKYGISSIKLAENSTSICDSLEKNTIGNNEDKSTKENNDSSANHKYNYRIDQKESIKFRQDLEKYRQTYA
jgi:hypothetical protein